MATAESVKTKIQGLLAMANEATGNSNTDLTTAVNALIAGFGQGGSGSVGGASGIYMAKITPAEAIDRIAINHNLGTTNILLVAAWAETLGDITPSTAYTLAKFWAKTDITTQRGGNGFSPGYSWNTTNNYAAPSAPNTAIYETLTITDENNVTLSRTQSSTNTYYHAGVTYTVVVIAENVGGVRNAGKR